jgi:predicted DNA-binding transcriptional regulator AlpA
MRHQITSPNGDTATSQKADAANINSSAREQLLRLNQIFGIIGLLPISRAKFYDLVKQGSLPQPIKLGSRISCWRRVDIVNFIESNAGGRGNG